MNEEQTTDAEYMTDEEYQVFKSHIEVLLKYRWKEESFSGLCEEESNKLNSEVRKHDPALVQPLSCLTIVSLMERINQLRSGWQRLEECHLFIPAFNEILDCLRGELHKLHVYDLPAAILSLPTLNELACITNNGSLRELWMSFHSMLSAFEKTIQNQMRDSDSNGQPQTGDSETKPPKKSRASHNKGDAEAKLIAALSKHHGYSSGIIETTVPIGGNVLGRLAGKVSKASVTALWKKHFGNNGIKDYERACTLNGGAILRKTLQLMNDDYSAKTLKHDLADAYREGALGEE